MKLKYFKILIIFIFSWCINFMYYVTIKCNDEFLCYILCKFFKYDCIFCFKSTA